MSRELDRLWGFDVRCWVVIIIEPVIGGGGPENMGFFRRARDGDEPLEFALSLHASPSGLDGLLSCLRLVEGLRSRV